MSDTLHEVTSPLRVRIDECDGTRGITTGHLLALADEARFDLYALLAEQGLDIPARHVAKAEQLRVARFPIARERVSVRCWLAAVGRTSYRVAHRVAAEDDELLAELTSTLVALPKGETPIDLAPLRVALGEPLELGIAAPEPPEGSVAFLRTLDAWPSHQNTGRHVARSRMVDWVDDVRRLAAERGAFELAGPDDGGALRTLSMVYEREAFAGDALRIAIAAHAVGVFDASLVRGRELVARMRLTV